MSEASIFARANDALDVGGLVGAKSRAGWTSLRGKAPCPICQGLKDFSFKRHRWKCHRSGESGSALDLQAQIWGLTPFEAACRVLNLDVEEQRKLYAQTKSEPRAHTPARSTQVVSAKRAPSSSAAPTIEPEIAAVIAHITSRLTPGDGTLVEFYFAARALPRRWATNVWFCADAPYDIDALYGRGRSFPAMVCFPEIEGARTGGIHVTYLRRDGSGKASVGPNEKSKKMWGPQNDAAGRPGGLVLVRPSAGALLCVAEGVENALACARVAGDAAGAFAAGSLNRFQGGMALDRWGRTDWRTPRADPDKPAATMRHKGPVLLCVDSDMKPLVLQPNTQWQRTIAPERRTQVSGLLAGHWWRRAGASDVRVLTPPAGKDANDIVREMAA